ncbi:MAG TPA: hypothetical protein VGN13_00505 [Solirubrobacteraceae bacterium]
MSTTTSSLVQSRTLSMHPAKCAEAFLVLMHSVIGSGSTRIE